MSLKHRVNVNLGILCVTLRGEIDYKIILTDESSIPGHPIYGPHQVKDILDKITRKYIDVDTDWLDIRFVGIYNRSDDEKKEININYGVIIPEDINLLNGEWVSLSEFKGDRKKLDIEYEEIIKNLSLVLQQ